MKKNGFITPLTLVLSFLLFSTMFYQIETLEQERAFLLEEKQVILLQQLLQMATTDMIELIKHSNYLEEGLFSYERGTVTYRILASSNVEVTLRFIAETNKGRKNQVIFGYNLTDQKLTKWMEI